jgi:hypothetical protein
MRDFTDQKELAEWQQCNRMMQYYLGVLWMDTCHHNCDGCGGRYNRPFA